MKGGTVEVSRLRGSGEGIKREDRQLFAWIPICKRPKRCYSVVHFTQGEGQGYLRSFQFNSATSTVFHFHHLSPCYGDKNKKLMRVMSDDKSIRCNDNI